MLSTSPACQCSDEIILPQHKLSHKHPYVPRHPLTPAPRGSRPPPLAPVHVGHVLEHCRLGGRQTTAEVPSCFSWPSGLQLVVITLQPLTGDTLLVAGLHCVPVKELGVCIRQSAKQCMAAFRNPDLQSVMYQHVCLRHSPFAVVLPCIKPSVCLDFA